MELFEALEHRRSVRKYTGQPIPQEKIDRIVDAGLLAPSSRNHRPLDFVVVKNRDKLKELSKAKRAGGSHLADCDAAIVVLADSSRSDTWVEDSSIALAYMHLAAVDQGVGSCWIQFHLRKDLLGHDAEENVRKILFSYDKKYRVVGALALGIPSETPKPKSVDPEARDRVQTVE